MNVKQIAEQATIQSFLNCYLRETYDYKLHDQIPNDVMEENSLLKSDQPFIQCKLGNLGIDLHLPLHYWSITGRHIFSFPIYYSFGNESRNLQKLDYITLVNFISKELSMRNKEDCIRNDEELLLRVILSCQSIENFILKRYPDTKHLYEMDMDFIDAEQALLFGHMMHPTPKSRQGIAEWDVSTYSPELKGEFPLHYFRVHTSIVNQGTALEYSASEIIKKQVLEDPFISDTFKNQYCQEDGYELIPIHPWQAEFVMRKPKVKVLMEEGLIESLGTQGRPYYPTSSLRTVYHPDMDYMIKFSLNVKITNSVRANKYMELERGIEVKQIMEGKIGRELKELHPNFQVICDPAFITVNLEGEKESGFEVILRENPFKMKKAHNATPVAALCQDSVESYSSRLAEIIKELAKKESKSIEEISVNWFRNYLDISLKPILWLFLHHGIAVEAHQQNSVVQLKDGYPDTFYYRDNQGYYFCESYHDHLNKHLPGISEKSNTICSDAIADERLRYYFFFNHLFGLINAFGTARLLDEKKLLEEVRSVLEETIIPAWSSSELVKSLLSFEKLPCKANLLTRFHDMDELTGSLETQSVYVEIENPLFQKELITNAAN